MEYITGRRYPWTGGKCPVPAKTIVEAIWSDGDTTDETRADMVTWTHDEYEPNLVAFTVVREAPHEIWMVYGDWFESKKAAKSFAKDRAKDIELHSGRQSKITHYREVTDED